jgi:hypothetical protein
MCPTLIALFRVAYAEEIFFLGSRQLFVVGVDLCSQRLCQTCRKQDAGQAQTSFIQQVQDWAEAPGDKKYNQQEYRCKVLACQENA